MSAPENNTNLDAVVGVVVLSRNGDLLEKYDDPSSYDPTSSVLSNLGEYQAFNLGSLLRSRYLSRYSSLVVSGLDANVYTEGQAVFMADAGDEGSVAMRTALGLVQGLYPATNASNMTTANGSRVVAPLNGLQFIPIDSVNPDHDTFLNGWTDCSLYNYVAEELFGHDPDFVAKSMNTQEFRDSLSMYVGDRSVSLENMYGVYRFLNGQSIWNATFSRELPHSVLIQARDVANWVSFNAFSDSDSGAVLNIAGRTFIPELLRGLGRVANLSDSLKLLSYTGGYQPFISLFRMLGMTETHPELEGLANYAAAMAFEVRRLKNSTSPTDLYVRVQFKNGSDANNFVPYPVFGRSDEDYDVPLAEFRSSLSAYEVDGAVEWCNACANSVDRGCDLITSAGLLSGLMDGTTQTSSHMSPVVAGVIGASVTLAVALLLIGIMTVFGLLGWSFKKPRPSSMHRRSTSVSTIVGGIVSPISPRKWKYGGGDTESVRGVVSDDRGFEMMEDVASVHNVPFDKKMAHN